MAKSGKGKTGKATPQKVVSKPQKVVQKVVQTPQKVVQQKPQQPTEQPKPPEQPIIKPEEKKAEPLKPEEIKQPEPIPETIPESIAETLTYEEVYLTEEEFDAKFKKADSSDCAEGVDFYIKERFGEKWFAKPVPKIGVATVDTAAFNDLVLRGTAYIKK